MMPDNFGAYTRPQVQYVKLASRAMCNKN